MTYLAALRYVVLAFGVLVVSLSAPAAAVPVDGQVRGQMAGLRVPFIANESQVDPRVAYYAPTFAGTVFVTRRGELVYSLPGRPAETPRVSPRPTPGWTLTETFVKGRPRPAAQDRSATGVSYFIGKDPSRWRPEVATYEEVGLGDVWSGVEVAVRAQGRSVEKIFTVKPLASVDRIRLRVNGARALRVDRDGALVARTGLGDVTFTAPVAYQERDGLRHPVTVAYRARGKEYGFTVGAYDRSLPLVIDPFLQSTYLGGTGFDSARAMAIHPTTGDVYVAGTTVAANFPGTAGGAQPAKAGFADVFVARVNAALTTLIQSTYLGGTDDDDGFALVIDPATGDVIVAGSTSSTDFPGTVGGAQPDNGGSLDGFVARLTSGLTTTALVQATYLGGSDDDQISGLALDTNTGDIFVTGYTFSGDFPGTAGGAQDSLAGFSNAFIARLTGDLGTGALCQATYLGGSAYDFGASVAIDPPTGDVLVTGYTYSVDFPGTLGGAQPSIGGFQDAFVARLLSSLDTTSLLQSTYLGGSDDDLGTSVVIHPATGDVYVTGYTYSTDFPGTSGGAQPSNGGFQDAFIARLQGSLTTNALTQATYLGGDDDDVGIGLAIDPGTGDVYVAGFTYSTNFPGTLGGAQPTSGGGRDAFAARLRSGLTTSALTQATYLGGSSSDGAFALALHPTTGELYLAGQTSSANFPRTAGGAQPTKSSSADAFITRMTASLVGVDAGPDVTVTKTHAGDFARGQVGATYTIVVSNIGVAPTVGTVTVTDSLPAGLVATALGGPGWACVLGTLTCTRSDALVNGAIYPDITLTVDVATDAAKTVTNTATVSGGADADTGNNTASDETTVLVFADVPTASPLSTWIDALAAAGITAGCASSPQRYCPDAGVTRDQMAVFLLRGIHGSDYVPPPATGTVFNDVPASHPLAAWIEQLFHEGITGGCSTSPPLYCPDAVVTRAEMAVFLLRAEHGSSYAPPPATGTVFTDVPASHPLAAWIEQLWREGITGGCATDPAQYCPGALVTRGQMAVFLVRTFQLPH